MRSRSSRSTEPSRKPARAGAADIYLFPAVVGGGLGDIEEVLSAGHHLATAGFPLTLFRRGDRPLPRGVEGPWDWPRLRRCAVLRPRHRKAVTVAPAWGVSAAPAFPGPLGRPGPWAEEAEAVERAYGPEQTLHVSLEEFARTLPLAREDRERLREGGVRSREIPGRLDSSGPERERFRAAFRRFRAFDRPNVLSLFAGFAPDRAFGRQFPEAVQVGPLWPHRRATAAQRGSDTPTWVWYASPASAEAILPEVLTGLREAGGEVRLVVRSPRMWPSAVPSERLQLRYHPEPAARWQRTFASADLRIVTGSRTLLDALALGGPFLYFNGVLGHGSARRRHRPEKIQSLLRVARSEGWPSELRRDLADFARGRRVAHVVRRAAERRGPWGRPFPRWHLGGYPPGREDLGRYLVQLVREFAESPSTASAFVAHCRGKHPPRGTRAGAGSRLRTTTGTVASRGALA